MLPSGAEAWQVAADNVLMRLKDEDWNDVLDTNLRGAFNTIRAASRGMMKKKGGRIINITSVVGITGNKGQANYAASKAGLIGFTKSVAFDYMKHGIRANALCPGSVESPSLHERWKATGDFEAAKKAFIARQPIGRIAQPEEVADLAVYLAGATYTTGQIHLADGGLATVTAVRIVVPPAGEAVSTLVTSMST